MKWLLILISIPILFHVARWLIEPKFTTLNTKSNTLEIYATSEEMARNSESYNYNFELLKSYYALVPDKRRRVVHSFSSKYAVVATGLYNYDDGLHYFIMPDYSFITIIDRKEMRMVKRLFFLEKISNMRIEDGNLYLYEIRTILPNRILVLSLKELGLELGEHEE